MKLLLTAALLFTASAGIAFAKDEGRYIVTGTGEGVHIWITDTKTGRTKWCKPAGVNNKPACTPWAEIDD